MTIASGAINLGSNPSLPAMNFLLTSQGTLLLVLVFLLLGIIALFRFLENQNGEVPQTESLLYKAKASVFDKREVMLFQELKRQIPEGYHIFPKMRLADIMETTAAGREFHGQFNRISKKHIDFLICDQYYKPVLAIELNGSSHQTVRAQKSDEFKKKAFENIDLRLVVVRVGSDFASAVQEVIKYV